jgi:diaminohydroxyphosphoribosylaminopyrimidine deaminase/5-amino-6-(5-phosphoribosylamino)uracil reductase
LGVTLKLATSLDGKIATASGESRWITGEEARQAAHRLRATHDAVVIGVETALADDPELTVRLDGYVGPQPARVVLDSRQRLGLSSKLVRTARQVPTIVISAVPPSKSLVDAGVRVFQVEPVSDTRPDLEAAVRALAEAGYGRLFVEGGGQVAGSFLRYGLVDRLEWFRASMVLGGEGRPCVGAMGIRSLADATRFVRTSVQPLGEDLWERYEKA